MARWGKGATFLSRLARDIRGNTVALAAAALLPLAGLIGGGVDMSRLYLVKTRLQQACDAGALAGRKAMGPGSWTTGTNSTQSRANSLFDANFANGAYGSGTRSRSYTESNGVVSGTASVDVPMTIMRIFGATSRTLGVNCTAKMEIPNTDVMFVLDVTGSMDCAAGSTSCYSPAAVGSRKIDGLKSAIKCFYEALEKVNTAEVCGNDPTASTYSGTAQIRLGFVPYNVNVNVGKLLPNAYMADSWTYQSRQYGFDGTYGSSSANGSWTQISGSSSNQNFSGQSSCPSDSMAQNTTGPVTNATTAQNGVITTTYTYTRTTTGFDISNCSGSGGGWNWSWSTGWVYSNPTYSYTKTTYTNYVEERTDTTTQTPNNSLVYKPVTLDVSGLKAGNSSWNNSVSLPVGTTGGNSTVNWDGCIEERQTVQNTDGTPGDDWATIPSAAYDMNIDLLPSATAGTKWGPMLADAVWGRYTAKNCSYYGCSYTNSYANVTTSSNLDHNNNYYCPTAARKLTAYTTASNLVTYVDSFSASGNTYHDIGMLWGARMVSPTGIFASENAQTSTGGQIQRHIIFMTDGDTNSNPTDYSAYGMAYWDRRQTNYDPSDTQLEANIDGRLIALCTAIKNMNITLWVISYGGGVNSTTETRLSQCATSGRYYAATDGAALISRFRQIAAEISELRLTS